MGGDKEKRRGKRNGEKKGEVSSLIFLVLQWRQVNARGRSVPPGDSSWSKPAELLDLCLLFEDIFELRLGVCDVGRGRGRLKAEPLKGEGEALKLR